MQTPFDRVVKMILYFTGTGNSKYCADFLSFYLGDEVLDLSGKIKSGDYSPVESEKSYVVCVPTYAWRIPAVVTELISKTPLNGSNDVYFVMTCGGQIGKAEKYNKELCEKIGKNYKGTLKVVMAENYLAMFPVTDEKQEELLMKQADDVLKQGASVIASNGQLPTVKEGALGALLSGKVNEMFNRFYLSDKKFYVKQSCVSCSVCAKECPLGNIEIKDGKPLWKGNCTQCMACISSCPKEAIEYGKKSIGQRRYRCRSFDSGK